MTPADYYRALQSRLRPRSVILQSGTSASYYKIRTWHQLFAIFLGVLTLISVAALSTGFWLTTQRLTETERRLASEEISETKRQLASEIQAKVRFVTQLDMHRQRANELRAALDAEIETRRELEETAQSLASTLSTVTGEPVPDVRDQLPAWSRDVAVGFKDVHLRQARTMEQLIQALDESLFALQSTVSRTDFPVEQPIEADNGTRLAQGGPVSDSGSALLDFDTGVERLLDLSQQWNETNRLLNCLPLSPPLDNYRLTSKYGARKDPFTGKSDRHSGIDLAASTGTRIRTPSAGVVIEAGPSPGYGQLVEIDHGCGITTRYGHLKTFEVEEGQLVAYRDVIGTVGNTGRSTGPHVHYEVRIDGAPVNPYNFIEAGRYVFKEERQTAGKTQQ